MVDPPPPLPYLPGWTHGGRDITKSLIEPRAEVRQPVPKLSNDAFSKTYVYCAVSWTSCIVTSTDGALSLWSHYC